MPRPHPIRALFALLLATLACASDPTLDPGVSRELADQRARRISDLRYDVHFDIPAERDSAVTGQVDITFTLADDDAPLVLDFRAPSDHVQEVRLDGARVEPRLIPDHIVLPTRMVGAGSHVVSVRFRSTDAALNRNDEFLYALFVPDRASTAFPVFEQPNLKAHVGLTLTVPAAWKALGNGPLVERDSTDAARHVLRFADSEPISTYLMTFAAGVLQEETAVRNGRQFTMYHRETDALRLRRNAPAIFDLHASALAWLEGYTGIAYPFGKFDFFAVPAFQFGGMEHPGAVWYRAGSLFLDESAGRTQELGRASLIAHETAHMWFGDLVTMAWFNDVWMKEVFANFMAAKIVGPSFPDVDQGLRFFQAHHPTAYGVDRTLGANPIRQPLENLREAGSLYGGIIYQKAPIVMQQLETMLGDTVFRDGLRIYLDRHRFGNATWPDLVSVLDSLSPLDVTAWSRVWVEEPGRPTFRARVANDTLYVTQEDTWPDRQLRWPQRIGYALITDDDVALRSGTVAQEALALPLAGTVGTPRILLGGADGVSYGRFALDSASRLALLERIHGLPQAVHRAVAWQALQEELIAGTLAPDALLDAVLRGVETERDELVASQALGLLRFTFWSFLDDSVRLRRAPEVERRLWAALERAPTPGRKGAFFSTLVSTTLSPAGITRLTDIWRRKTAPPGLPLSEQQYTGIAEALAVRGVADAERMLDEEATRITNADRRARLAFIRPALSIDVAVRARFFETLKQVETRRQESWVLDAVSHLNHPLRAEASLPLLRPSLDLVLEIQRTGDIFFPLRWMNAVLDGHRSAEAEAVVRRFLDEHPDYPPRLKGKMLQAAHLVLNRR